MSPGSPALLVDVPGVSWALGTRGLWLVVGALLRTGAEGAAGVGGSLWPGSRVGWAGVVVTVVTSWASLAWGTCRGQRVSECGPGCCHGSWLVVSRGFSRAPGGCQCPTGSLGWVALEASSHGGTGPVSHSSCVPPSDARVSPVVCSLCPTSACLCLICYSLCPTCSCFRVSHLLFSVSHLWLFPVSHLYVLPCVPSLPVSVPPVIPCVLPVVSSLCPTCTCVSPLPASVPPAVPCVPSLVVSHVSPVCGSLCPTFTSLCPTCNSLYPTYTSLCPISSCFPCPTCGFFPVSHLLFLVSHLFPSLVVFLVSPVVCSLCPTCYSPCSPLLFSLSPPLFPVSHP